MTQTKKKAATVRCGDRPKSPASRPSPSLSIVPDQPAPVKPSAPNDPGGEGETVGREAERLRQQQARHLVAWMNFYNWAFGVESTEAAS